MAFAVADEHQGRGLSTLLLEHLAAIARTERHRPVHRRGAGRQPGHARGVRPCRLARHPGVRQRHHRRRVRHRARRPAYLDTVERREQRAESRSIARLLRPRSVAVVGASDEPSSVGRALMQNLLSSGFAGPVYAVNPAHEQVANMRCYPTLLDVPDDVALAIVAVPPEPARAGARRRDREARPGPGHRHRRPAEAGARRAPMVRRLVSRARGNGLRIIGPASMGFLTTGARLAVAGRARRPPASPRRGVDLAAVRARSAPASWRWPRGSGVGLASFVSLGDRADVSGNDLLQYWEDDPETKVVLVYTESFGNPRKFARIARRVVTPQAHRRRPGRRLVGPHDRGAVRAGRRHPGPHRPGAVRHRQGARRRCRCPGATG